jgi:PAS domain S-box-containing protein
MQIKKDLWNPSVSMLIDILDNSPNGIFICNDKGYLVAVNKAYERINQVKEKEIVGKTLNELVEMGFIETSIGLLVMESKQPASIIQRLPKIKKELLVKANPIFEKNGKLSFIIGVSLDLNELTREKWELWKTENQIMNGTYQEGNNGSIIAKSDLMKNTLNLAYRVAQSKISVLIRGESGVGKDVLARYIHQNSAFRNGPFISLNCAALPPDLLESELFGYEPGAFTGAKKDGKPGILELAKEGTLFLDEIGDLPISLQPKLLRVLEEHKMRRLGGTKNIPVDFRLISATNRDLKRKITEGTFREDLYFRIAGVAITIPPLRERPEDIVALANYFLKRLNDDYNMSKTFSRRTIEALLERNWPGNVRELKNCIERTMILADCDIIEPENLLLEDTQIDTPNTNPNTNINDFTKRMEKIEKDLILQAYEKYHSTRKAAKSLGMSQSSFMRKLQKYRKEKL